MTMTINPNQPPPVVLSSNLAPPPTWPLPVNNWVVLPVVPAGFPAGPFTPTGDSLFSATTQGDVPASGGGTVNFLRADGSWVPPA